MVSVSVYADFIRLDKESTCSVLGTVPIFGFFASCGCELIEIFDLVPNLLEEVSVVGVEAHDEVGIGEKVVSDKISRQLAINVLLWVGFSDLD